MSRLYLYRCDSCRREQLAPDDVMPYTGEGGMLLQQLGWRRDCGVWVCPECRTLEARVAAAADAGVEPRPGWQDRVLEAIDVERRLEAARRRVAWPRQLAIATGSLLAGLALGWLVGAGVLW